MSWAHEERLIGVCVEAARRAFSAVGLALEVEPPVPWSRCQLMVETGEVDVNLCGFATDKRREYAVMVAPPVGRNEAVLIVRQDSRLVYRSWKDLTDLRIGIGRGVSFGSEFDTYLAQHTRLDIALSETLNLRKLALNRLDAVVTARVAGQKMIRGRGCAAQFRMLPGSVVEGSLFMQMSKQSRYLDLVPQLTAFLNQPAELAWRRDLQIRLETRYAQLYPLPLTEPCER